MDKENPTCGFLLTRKTQDCLQISPKPVPFQTNLHDFKKINTLGNLGIHLSKFKLSELMYVLLQNLEHPFSFSKFGWYQHHLFLTDVLGAQCQNDIN